jgi:hypothetical protein
MTKMKRRHFAAVVVFIFGVIFFVVTFLKYVPPPLFKALIKTLKAPQAPPEEIFMGYVLNPIPESVTNIKADQPSKFSGYTYTFRFNISRDDLALLIDSRPFIEVWNVKYKNGIFEWGLGHAGPIELKMAKYAHSMPLYDNSWSGPHEPAWFKPGLWDNFEAYAFHKEGNLVNIQVFERDGQDLGGRVTIQVLLYNEKEGEAYFIISSWEH